MSRQQLPQNLELALATTGRGGFCYGRFFSKEEFHFRVSWTDLLPKDSAGSGAREVEMHSLGLVLQPGTATL